MPKDFLSDEEMMSLSNPKAKSKDFISDQEMMDISQVENMTKPSSPSIGQYAQAVLEGYGNAATLGYLPQLQAKFGELIGKEGSYTQLRDENIKRQEEQEEQMPMTATAGKVVGTLATIPLGGMLGKAAGMGAASSGLGRVAQASAVGAGIGALQNPGDEEGVVAPIQAGKRISNAQIGALAGGLLQGGGELASVGIKSIGKLSDISEKQVKKALNRYLSQSGAAIGGYEGYQRGGIEGAIVGAGAGLIGATVAKNAVPKITKALKEVGKKAKSLEGTEKEIFDPFKKEKTGKMLKKPGLLDKATNPVQTGIIGGELSGERE